MKKRKLYKNIWKMLSAHKQMVFIAGPRRAGKNPFTQILAIIAAVMEFGLFPPVPSCESAQQDKKGLKAI
jgi:hypothetical protein